LVNGYFIVALCGLLAVEAIDWSARLLNLRALEPEVPAEFADVYDAAAYRRSQDYTRVNTRFSLVESMFDLAVLLAFWLAGGFGWLDGLIRDWGLHPIWSGLLFFVILVVAKGVLSLPFNAYAVFVIEERFGFNRTNRATFILDLLKGLVVGAAIGLPLMAGFLALFTYAGRFAWIYAWAAVVAFSFLMQIIAPAVIMPLFNKFTPVGDGELKEAILGYAKKVDFPLTGVFSIDASRRSSKGNAFFTGFGKRKRIALFDTLIERSPVEELVAVLAHEVGHYKKRHVLIGTIAAAAETGLFLGLFSVFLHQQGLFAAFGVDTPGIWTGVVFVSVLLQPVELVLSVGRAALSRQHERQADRFAARTTGRGDLLASGLKRLSKDNLSNLTPHPFYVFLEYSHPPTLERVRALRDSEGGFGAAGLESYGHKNPGGPPAGPQQEGT
jgi:STE24 endopeptidase